MKIWLYTTVDEKIIKSFVYSPEVYRDSEIEEYVKEICNEIDEPTPVFLNKHFMHMQNFNNTHFTSVDFIEYISFDKMVVEVFDDKDKRNAKK